MWRGGLQLLVGDLDLNLMWLVFLASFYSCGCFCRWDSDVPGKKHRRNRDLMRTEMWVESGLGKENRRSIQKKSMAEIGKRTRIWIERRLTRIWIERRLK